MPVMTLRMSFSNTSCLSQAFDKCDRLKIVENGDSWQVPSSIKVFQVCDYSTCTTFLFPRESGDIHLQGGPRNLLLQSSIVRDGGMEFHFLLYGVLYYWIFFFNKYVLLRIIKIIPGTLGRGKGGRERE